MDKSHILIVEDNRIVAEDLKQTLMDLGYVVAGIATSGKKALELVAENHVDLGLLDINLGKGTNGIDLALELRRTYRIPVVFLTAHADRDTIARAKKAEPLGYLVKPFDTRELLSTIDIAMYKYHMAEKVRESEARYRSFVENFQGIAFRGTADFRFEFMAGKVTAITGYTEKQFLSGEIRYDDLVHPEDIRQVRNIRAQFAESSRRTAQTEYRILDRDGNLRWVMENVTVINGDAADPAPESGPSQTGGASGSVKSTESVQLSGPVKRNDGRGWLDRGVRLDGTIQDITQRKAAETEIFFLKAAVDHAAESITVTDAQGHIQYVNKAFEKMTGYTRDELMGRTPNILKSGAHTDAFYDDLWQTLLKKETWYGQFQNIRKDGTTFHEKATISPVMDSRGIVTHYIAVKRDITDDLAKDKMLRQSQKLESIGTLAGGIAHDFNNILAPIIGFTQLSLQGADPGSILEDNLTEINAASQRAKELVAQILTFARHSNEGVSPIRIHPIVKEALKFIRSSIPANIAIEADIGKTKYVLGDPTQVHQIIMNLCTNAYQAMGTESGTLGVVLKNREIGSGHAGLPAGPYVMLEISDTGCGIPEDDLTSIFEPYFTTKERGEGTGLGLSVCQGAVKSMKGEIFVKSRPGKGTCFSVFLPVLKGHENRMHDMVEEKLPRGSESILFVDDEIPISKMAMRTLENLGYRVAVFNGSQAALDAFIADPGAFDLMITDMTMPGMTGDILAGKVKAVRPDIPVILSTGYSEKMSAREAEEQGIDAFLRKPVAHKDLAETVRRLLDRTNGG